MRMISKRTKIAGRNPLFYNNQLGAGTQGQSRWGEKIVAFKWELDFFVLQGQDHCERTRKLDHKELQIPESQITFIALSGTKLVDLPPSTWHCRNAVTIHVYLASGNRGPAICGTSAIWKQPEQIPQIQSMLARGGIHLDPFTPQATGLNIYILHTSWNKHLEPLLRTTRSSRHS